MSDLELRHYRRILLGACACAALTVPSLAWAQATQDEPPPNQPSATEATSSVEEEDAIVITAQRRAELLEDVPMTVGVASEQTLEAAGATSLRDITRVISGVQLSQAGAFPQPTIRGVTTLINGTSFENNVAVYVDGFYEPAPQALAIDIPNVSNIQVLKGPQGTLYGRNATGGAILINTVTPTDEWQGKAELTYARFDDMRIGGYFAGPLAEGIGASISAYSRKSDGWMRLASRTVPGETDGDAAPIEQDLVRAKLKLDLINNFSATVGYNFIHTSNAVGNMFTPLENVSPIYGIFPGGATLPTRIGVAAWDHDVRVETFSHQGTLALAWDNAIGELKSYTGYQSFKPTTSFDFDGSYINLTFSSSQFRQKTFQQAVDFAIDSIQNVDLIVGATYFKDRLKTIGSHPRFSGTFSGTNPLDPGTTPPDFTDLVRTGRGSFRLTKEAWAAYVDATVHLGDFHITAGGRYSKETQDVFAESICLTPTSGACAAILPDANGDRFIFPPTSNKTSYKKFTPRASIRYEIAPRTNVYASYSQGFRSGAWNASLPQLAPVVPGCVATPAVPCELRGGPSVWRDAEQEVVDAFEIGFKTARRNFRFELSAFYYDYKDLQVSVTQTTGDPPGPQTLVVNAPKAKVKGIEGSFEYRPIENLSLRGGATWLDAEYGDGFIVGGAQGLNCTTLGINTNSDPLKTCLNISQDQDLSGLQMSRAPKIAANFGATYDIPIGEGGIRLAGNVHYTSSYVVTNPAVWGNHPSVPADRQREQRFRQSGYALLSASVQYTEPSGHLYLRIWGNNLTNKKYRLHYTGTSFFGTYMPMAEPRTYGATLGFSF